MNSAVGTDNANEIMATIAVSKTLRRERKTVNVKEYMPEIGSPKTPSRRRTYANSQKTPNSQVTGQTPRRSTRKIFKPFQDYNDIVRPLATRKSIAIEIIKENNDLEFAPLKAEIEGKCISDKENIEDITKTISIEIKVNDNLVLESPLEEETEDTKEEQTEKCVGNAPEPISVDILKENDDLGLAPLQPELGVDEEISIKNPPETVLVDILNENDDLGLAPLQPDLGVDQEISIKNPPETVLVDILKENEDLGLAPLQPELGVDEEIFIKYPPETVLVDILKANDDLGLAPLQPDIEKKCHEGQEKFLMSGEQTTKKDAECKEFEEMESLIFCDEDEEFDCNETTNVNNDTFNASDCIILSPIDNQETQAGQVVAYQKIPCTDNYEKFDALAKPQSPKKLANVLTEFTPQNCKTLFTNIEIQEEQKRRESKLPRIPTPFKPKKQNTLNDMSENIANEEEVSPMKNIILPVIEMNNENIMLQGIRKTSVFPSSIETNNANNVNTKRGAGNRVTFYSPANQTVVIEEFDGEMERKKNEILHEKENKKIPIIPIIPTAQPSTPAKKNLNKSTASFKAATRIPKIPNTKTEILKANMKPSFTSTTNISILNVSSKFNAKPRTDTKQCIAEMPKSKVPQPHQNLALAAGKELPKLNKSMQYVQAATRIPTKKLEIPKMNVKTTLNSTTLTKASTSILNSTSRVDLKPKTETLNDKIAMRRQRHMEMFKGRGDRMAEKPGNTRHAIIRGVRSNRRFDLQMQHRHNLEN